MISIPHFRSVIAGGMSLAWLLLSTPELETLTVTILTTIRRAQESDVEFQGGLKMQFKVCFLTQRKAIQD